jgi:hypothetical protein
MNAQVMSSPLSEAERALMATLAEGSIRAFTTKEPEFQVCRQLKNRGKLELWRVHGIVYFARLTTR